MTVSQQPTLPPMNRKTDFCNMTEHRPCKPRKMFLYQKVECEDLPSLTYLAEQMNGYISSMTCEKSFRDYVINRLPALNRDNRYLAFFTFLLFGYRLCKVNDRLMIQGKLVAACMGRKYDYQHKNLNTGDFLEDFRRDVLPDFRYSKYDRKSGASRVVLDTGLPDDISKLFAEQQDKNASDFEKRVCFLTGKAYNKTFRKDLRLQAAELAYDIARQPLCEAQRLVLDYLNNLNPKLFSKVLVHLNEAKTEANNLPLHQKNAALNTIRAIEDQPKPYYAPSRRGNTVRVHGVNPSLLSLKSSIRKKLTQDWTDYDLVSSQLAICASLWNVADVYEFLVQGQDIWVSIFSHFGLNYEKYKNRFKPDLKQALYATLYGSTKANIVSGRPDKNATGGYELKGGLTQSELGKIIPEVGDRFFSHFVVDAMYKAGMKERKRVKEEKGAWDCFNRWIPVVESDDESTRVDAKSIVCQVAQAQELQLLLPVFQLANENQDRFQIALFQHDGFSVAFTSRDRKNRWSREIHKVVEEEAVRLSIPTKLKED